MFLTEEELYRMTDYKSKAKQCRWLARNGIPFTMNRYGHPRVAKEIYLQIVSNTPMKNSRTQPNTEGYRKFLGQ